MPCRPPRCTGTQCPVPSVQCLACQEVVCGERERQTWQRERELRGEGPGRSQHKGS